MDSNQPLEVRPALGRNLTYGLLDTVGRDIVIGVYADQSFPTEAELAKRHGVSRSVTREAVKMLTAKGLLTARPRQGTMVQPSSQWNLFDPDILRWILERQFSVELLKHFSQLRLAVEPTAAALAASAGSWSEIKAIKAGFDRMVAAEAGQDDALDADIAFHIAILKASANPFFIQFCDVVETALRTSIRFTNRIKGHSASLAAHRAVLDSIVARDPHRAQRAMNIIIADVMVLIERAQT